MSGFIRTKRIFMRCTALTLTFLMLSLSLFGCTQSASSVEVLSQKATPKGKMQITVLIKHAFQINGFEAAVEEKFPDVDIIQVGNFTPAFSPDEYVARLKNDDLTDIVMTWPLSFGEEYWEDQLLDLSSLPVTTRYNVSMLDTISKDGKLYYLPGPAQVRGLIYNKTMFEENGWAVPSNYDEFIKLCKTIEATGIRAIQLGFENPEVLDTAFIGYGYADSFATPKDAQWITNYVKGEGQFLDHFSDGIDTFQQMIEAGIWKSEDLQVDYSDREKMIVARECAMVEDSLLLTRLLRDSYGSSDEFAMMPFFNPGEGENDWVRLYMVCYIGLNKHLAEAKNKEKYEKVLEIMDYISTPEGQSVLAEDTGVMYSSLKDTLLPTTPETESLVSALEHGRYAIFPEIPNIQTALRQALAAMLEGDITKEDVGRIVDEANKTASSKEEVPLEVLAVAEEDFTLVETGNFIADQLKELTDCQIALYLDGGKDGRTNAKGVGCKLYKGDLTSADIARLTPDYRFGEKGEIWKITMTGENLQKTLEHSITIDNDAGWFYYFSGLRMRFDPTAEPGTRIKQISMADKSNIQPDAVYTIAVTENTVPEEFMLSCEKTGVLLKDLLEKNIRDQKTIAPAKDNRFILP